MPGGPPEKRWRDADRRHPLVTFIYCPLYSIEDLLPVETFIYIYHMNKFFAKHVEIYPFNERMAKDC